MICLEVVINGLLHCTAGVQAPSRTITSVTAAVICDADDNPELNQVVASVFGVTKSEPNPFPLTWPKVQLGVGDEVTIRIVERSEVSTPVNTLPFTAEEFSDRKRKLYERLKQEFESSSE